MALIEESYRGDLSEVINDNPKANPISYSTVGFALGLFSGKRPVKNPNLLTKRLDWDIILSGWINAARVDQILSEQEELPDPAHALIIAVGTSFCLILSAGC